MRKELMGQALDLICPIILGDNEVDELAELNKAGLSIPVEFIDLLIDRCEGVEL